MTNPSGRALGKRILHVIDTGGPGGAETVLCNMVRGLAEDAWTSRVLIPSDDWLMENIRKIGGAEAALVSNEGSANLRYLQRLTQEIRRFRPWRAAVRWCARCTVNRT
jgi:hypothetical protein